FGDVPHGGFAHVPPPGRSLPVSIAPFLLTKSPSALPPPPLPFLLLPRVVPVPAPGPTPVPWPSPKPSDPRLTSSPLMPVNLSRLVDRLRSMMLSRTLRFLSSNSAT